MNRMLQTLGVTSLAAIATGGNALGQIGFDLRIDYTIASTPEQTATGDLDGDGDCDLAVTCDGPDRVRLLMNDGVGGFGTAIDVNLPSGSSAKGLCAGDLDGDLDLDLAVALHGTDQVIVLVNQGGGAFTLGATYPVGQGPRHVVAAFLDGNTTLDLAVACRDNASVDVLLNLGTGLFGGTASYPAGLDTRAIAAADVDGDGDQDVAAAAHDSEAIVLLINNGSGVFASGTSLSTTPVKPEGVVAGDLDQDGDQDLAAAGSGGGFDRLSVFIQVSPGAFAASINYPTTGVDPGSLCAGDFDLDYDLDLAVVNESSANVSLFANSGAGAFGVAQLLVTDSNPVHVTAAHLDGSGSLDLIATNDAGDSVSVLINQANSAFTDLGFALAGSNGLPSFVGIGTLEPLTNTTAVLANGLAGATAFLIVGVTRIDIAFAGGTFVPALDALVPFVLDGNGGFTFQDTWPNDSASGDTFYFQVWILDPAGPKKFSASNALQAIVP